MVRPSKNTRPRVITGFLWVIEVCLTNLLGRDLPVLILIHQKNDHPVRAALYQRKEVPFSLAPSGMTRKVTGGAMIF